MMGGLKAPLFTPVPRLAHAALSFPLPQEEASYGHRPPVTGHQRWSVLWPLVLGEAGVCLMSFPWSCSPTTAMGPTPARQIWACSRAPAAAIVIPLPVRSLPQGSLLGLCLSLPCLAKLLPDFLNSDTVCKSFAQPTFAENFTEQQTLSAASGLCAGPFSLLPLCHLPVQGLLFPSSGHTSCNPAAIPTPHETRNI